MSNLKGEANFFDDTSNILKEGIKRRFADPIISTFTVTFLIWNYEITIFALSGLDADAKIKKIQDALSWCAFLCPLALALFILFLFPILARRGYRLIEANRVIRENIRIENEEQLLPFQQSISELNRKLLAETERVNEGQRGLSERDKEIGKLLEKLSSSEQTKAADQAQIATLSGQIQNLQSELSRVSGQGSFPPSPSLTDPKIDELIVALQLNKAINGSIRDFAESMKLEPDEAVERFMTAARKVIDYVHSRVIQSKQANEYKVSITDRLNKRDFGGAREILESLKTVPSLRPEERLFISFAQEILNQIARYLN